MEKVYDSGAPCLMKISTRFSSRHPSHVSYPCVASHETNNQFRTALPANIGAFLARTTQPAEECNGQPGRGRACWEQDNTYMNLAQDGCGVCIVGSSGKMYPKRSDNSSAVFYKFSPA